MLEDDGLHNHGEHVGHGWVGQRGRADERRGDVMVPVVLALLAEELDAGFGRGRHFLYIQFQISLLLSRRVMNVVYLGSYSFAINW